MPYLRLSQPKPPPSVSPAMPVVELMPTGVARPWAWVAASRSASVAPPSMVDAAPGGVHSRGLHLRQVDHEPVVAHGIAGDVVPAAADGEHAARCPARKFTARDDVRRAGAARDDRGTLVDHRVPDLPRAVVGAVAREQNLSREATLSTPRSSWLAKSSWCPPYRSLWRIAPNAMPSALVRPETPEADSRRAGRPTVQCPGESRVLPRTSAVARFAASRTERTTDTRFARLVPGCGRATHGSAGALTPCHARPCTVVGRSKRRRMAMRGPPRMDRIHQVTRDRFTKHGRGMRSEPKVVEPAVVVPRVIAV